jgi:hypothetical protein
MLSKLGELGYGRARILNPADVMAINSLLSQLDFKSLCRTVDPASEMIREIYAGSGLRGDLEYLREPFEILREAYRVASSKSAGMLAYLT